MKKILMAIIFGLLLISPVALAQKAVILQERQMLKEQLQDQREEIRQNIQKQKTMLQQEAKTVLQNVKNLTPEERQAAKQELQAKRGAVLEEAQALRQNLKENAKVLRDNFREKVKSAAERARIALAHGKGLRMLNRFRSAVVRLDHILGRLESRIEKLESRGIDASSVTPLLEEAKNMSVQNKAKMEELKLKYESLLEAQNPQGIGEEARRIAKELKAETEKMHVKLKEIILAIKALVPEEANTQQ